MLPGRATAEGTARLAERFGAWYSEDFYRPLAAGRGAPGARDAVSVAARDAGALLVSSIGCGTYLGNCDAADDALYARSTRNALERGVNLLDTAINYRCQRSERTVGLALLGAAKAGVVARDEVVVCTKGGYVPFDDAPCASRQDFRDYLQREYFDRGVMTPDDVVAGGHCLAPTYLAHQIDRSRANLGLETLDVYYLHNPEQQLDTVSPAEFRERMRAAFALLEMRCAAGEIGRYGCATWAGFRVPPDQRGHLSLAELVGIARQVGGEDHHFRVVQLPINLACSEAARAPTQRLSSGAEMTLLEAAAALGVAVVASASLMQAKLTANLPPKMREILPGLRTDAQRAIAFVRGLPVVSAALVGMKSPGHLEENLGAGKK